MPFQRCKFYDDQGNSLGGCRRLKGGHCEFVHPSEPAWDSALPPRPFDRNHEPRGPAGDRGRWNRGGRGFGGGGRDSGWGRSSSNRTSNTQEQEREREKEKEKGLWSGFSSGWDTGSSGGGGGWGAPPASTSGTTGGWGTAVSAGGWGTQGSTAAGGTGGWGVPASTTDETPGGWGTLPESTGWPSPQTTASGAGDAGGWAAATGGAWGAAAEQPTNSGGWAQPTTGKSTADTWGEFGPTETTQDNPPDNDAMDIESVVESQADLNKTSNQVDARVDRLASTESGQNRGDRSPLEPGEFADDLSLFDYSRSGTLEPGEVGRGPRRLPKKVPTSLQDRKKDILTYFKYVGRAVQCQIELKKAEEDKIRWKRTQASPQYQHVGRAGRNILDAKRVELDDKIHLLQKKYSDYVRALSELHPLDEYVSGYDPDVRSQSAVEYVTRIQKWIAETQPRLEAIIAQEEEEQIKRRDRPADEPEFVPPSLASLFSQLRVADTKLDDMEEKFHHQASLALDAAIENKLEARREELAASSVAALAEVRDQTFMQPLEKLHQDSQQHGEGIEKLSDMVASHILGTKVVNERHAQLLVQNTRLRADVEEVTAIVSDNDAKLSTLQSQMEQMQQQLDQLDAGSQPRLQDIMSGVQPRLQEYMDQTMYAVLERVDKNYVRQITAHHADIFEDIWPHLQSMAVLTELAVQWFGNELREKELAASS